MINAEDLKIGDIYEIKSNAGYKLIAKILNIYIRMRSDDSDDDDHVVRVEILIQGNGPFKVGTTTGFFVRHLTYKLN